MTIDQIVELLKRDAPHNGREKRLVAALRAALDGLRAINGRRHASQGSDPDVGRAVQEIERELVG